VRDINVLETLFGKKQQLLLFLPFYEQSPHPGIHCNDVGTKDVRDINVLETLFGKKQQLLLASQVINRSPSRCCE
jgi:hypothetical protein